MMDAARYARVRELFLAAEELSPEQQQDFLQRRAGDDPELLEEVRSLLEEHDPETARREGQEVLTVPSRSTFIPTSSNVATASEPKQENPAGNHPALADSFAPLRHGSRITSKQQPRHKDVAALSRPASESHSSPAHNTQVLWARQARRSRRRTSSWLWLAALLPTALVGWWTYRNVDSAMQQSVANELQGIADSVGLASQRFLADKAQLVQSWSRQPAIQQAITELASDSADASTAENKNPKQQIESQLQQLSGYEDVRFVVWNTNYRTIASWRREEVGKPIAPDRAAHVTRAIAGETVLYGPVRNDDSGEFLDEQHEWPMMAIIVPVDDDQGNVIAAMMVHGIGLYREFNRMFMNVALAGDLDVYAVDRNGTMLTDSPHALAMAVEQKLAVSENGIAARLRVTDPGSQTVPAILEPLQREAMPLTVSAASATSGRSNVRTDAYRNYVGQPVVGAWRWHEEWNLGVIIERMADAAFAPARIVRIGFISLGSLLFLTAFVAAARISHISTRQQAAVHPLNRYEILGELGSGGMGTVYQARHRQLGRDTALKILIADRRSPEDQLRFDREARLAASLSNPHSVTIYDYGRSEDGEAYCVMELLQGLTLHQVVARSGPQPIGRVLAILRQICDALAEAHSLDLLHRDIKPQNVMLSLDASVGDWAIVFDYGLAKPLKPLTDIYQTSETIWSGTPMYMPPERFREPSATDPRSDIYSVGCLAYFLLSGHSPFAECDPESLFALIISEEPASIESHRQQPVPDDIVRMVATAMAKRAEERYESISSLSQVIDQLRVEYPWSVEQARLWWRRYGEESAKQND